MLCTKKKKKSSEGTKVRKSNFNQEKPWEALEQHTGWQLRA